ncbi:MAG TPA: pilus assembly protein TadG-related protein [Rhizomicrobium sp.]
MFAKSFAKSLADSLRRFLRSNRANVAMTVGLAAVPCVFLVGMGIDYTSATWREDQLNAAADAAALAGVTPAMMAQDDAASIASATGAFNAQAGSVSGVLYQPGTGLTVTATDTLTTRTVTVAYTATSQDAFPNVLGRASVALGGTSSAVGGLAPNINFYMLLDSSPSTAIAATQAGIDSMVAHTGPQGGCAFGCHESNPGADNLGNPGGEDNYALARSLGVTLRLDLVAAATQSLMTTAQTTEQTNKAKYEMAIDTFDVGVTTIAALTADLPLAESEAGNIAMLEVYKNNWLTPTNNNNDEDTDYDTAMSTLNTLMPAPGNGTNTKGDTPQEVLFFVTDGVEDETVNGARQQSLMNNGWCSTVKARGIRIAVLYTEYLPLPTNTWYNTYIAPFQADVGPTLESCASPGLYYEVTTDGDITAALADLFQKAVTTSYLSK